jgi:hypothetical protein
MFPTATSPGTHGKKNFTTEEDEMGRDGGPSPSANGAKSFLTADYAEDADAECPINRH